jgi:hypothetical protein
MYCKSCSFLDMYISRFMKFLISSVLMSQSDVVPLSPGQIFVISEHMLIGANLCVLVLGHISERFPFKKIFLNSDSKISLYL